MALMAIWARYILLAVVVSFTSGCYVSRLAWHQNELFNNRRPIAEMLADPQLPEAQRSRLTLLTQVLTFAEATGLNAQGAYVYFIDAPGNVVSYLVQAAHKDQLKSKSWWFPVVGSVPYRGYFDKSQRDRMASELESQGFDVHRSGAGAFSSLGWFEDPLFSSMLGRDRGAFVHLILHELVHRTLWVPGSVKFNENVAEFAATALSRRFFQEQGWQEEALRYEQRKADKELFKSWLQRLRHDLKAFYSRADLTQQQKIEQRQEIFSQYAGSPPAFKAYNYVGKRPWNNARVLAASLYSPRLALFERAQKCSGLKRVVTFLHYLKNQIKSDQDAFMQLAQICQKKSAKGLE